MSLASSTKPERATERPGRLRASICIPTYNRREILRRTLESLAWQDEPAANFEVLVGDDGSTDGTLEMVRSLDVSYRLQGLSQPNAGPAAATNLAASHATNEILILLDDDQVAAPWMIDAHIRAHEKYGDVLVQGLFPLAPDCQGRGASLLYEQHLLQDLSPLDLEHPFRPDIWSANVSVRRSTFERVGGLDATFREYGGEDTDLGIRVAAAGCPVIFVPRALSYHVHVVGYGSVRRQPYNAGRAAVRIAGLYGRSLDELSGVRLSSGLNRALRAGWRLSPPVMDGLGRGLTLGLRAADLAGHRRLQLLSARAVHRLYKVGGITRALMERASANGPARGAAAGAGDGVNGAGTARSRRGASAHCSDAPAIRDSRQDQT